MAAFSEYDPLSLVLNWLGAPAVNLLEGIVADSFFAPSRNVPTWRLVVGTDGEPTRIRTNNFSGTVEWTLRRASNVNSILSAILQADEVSGLVVAPMLMTDFGGLTVWSSPQAWLEGWPDDSYGKGEGFRRWVLTCVPLVPFLGGGHDVDTGPIAPAGSLSQEVGEL